MKKFIALFMLFGVLMFSAPVVQAVTIEDLQKEIQGLKEQVSVLKSQISGQVLGATTASPTGTNLTGCSMFMPPSVRMITPNGGETYQAGDSITLKWTSCNIPASTIAKITMPPIYYQGNYIPVPVLNLFTPNTGSATFTLPNPSQFPPLVYGNYYKFHIDFPSLAIYGDDSDNLFAIKHSGPWLPGCTSHAGYSSENGKPCNTSGSIDMSCINGNNYSSSTGLSCNPTQDISLYSGTVSSYATPVSNSGNNNDIGLFVINFDVTAWNGDIYLPKIANYQNSNVILYSADMKGSPETGGLNGVISCNSCESTAQNHFLIKNGETERLKLTVQINNSQTTHGAGSYKVKLEGIRWNADDSGTFFHYIPLPLNDPKYMTSYIYLN